MGESARDGELYLCGSYECLEPWLEMQTSTKLSPQDTIRKVLKRRCLKCPCIVHLDLICMSYDKKKGQKSNWKFDSSPQTPWKQGSTELWLSCAIHHWKDIFEGYKILPSHLQNRLDLKKIWMSKTLGQQESQFWDSHFKVSGKDDIWM
jgi:hypothetical protein